ncbi:Alpha-protein kinase 2 [Bagarius yarrelli]|uniref:non-specific serine/threonine protein kinase n=1 Tax=Bagarius yarrelli TaxID=175774 RepID=A0A556V858_BAGYA|nr:Alpha-protein kinase 2 [Bagarius yarrelli]
MSTGADGNKGIVKLPKNVTSQDVEFDGNESRTIPRGHQNTGVIPNNLITSTNQKTKVPENRQGGNTEPTNTPSQDESPLLEPNNETSTIDDIPHTEFYPALISGTVYTADTHKDYFMDKAVHHTDPKIKVIAEATLCDSEIDNISLENVCLVKNLNSDPEIGGILEDTVQGPDLEISVILEDTVQNIDSDIDEILKDTVQGNVSEISGILEETVQSTQSEIGRILEDTVQSTVLNISGSSEDNDQSIDSEISGLVEDTVQSTVVKIDGIVEDNGQSIDSEIGGTLEDALGMIQQPSPLSVDELSNKNVLKAYDNNAISDIQTDSTANSVENDMTQMSKSLTVNEKTDREPASCLSEDLVASKTENNPDVGLLIPSFPHTPIRIPSKTGKGINYVTHRNDTSNELWVDALDEWGYRPISCPSSTSSDNTKTLETESKSGFLELPTVESWSSSDSWASALSDWIQSVKVLPEDSNTSRSPASQHQCFITAGKSTCLQSDFESGNGYFESKMSIGPPVDLSDLHGEKENSFYTKSDISKHQNMEEETQSGVKEVEDKSENKCTERRLENKCVFKQESNALWEVTEDTAFEEEGERDHGGLSFSCYPIRRESEGYLHQEHLTDSRGGFSVRELDTIMPLTPITIGTSFLHLKEDLDEPRTSLNPSIVGISDGIRPDLTQSFTGKSTSKITGDQESYSSPCEDLKYKTAASDVSPELQRLIFPTEERLMICEEKQVAYVMLEFDDILSFKKQTRSAIKQVNSEVCERDSKMPRKNLKNSSENKPHLNKHKDKTNKNQQQKRENMRPEDGAVESGGIEDSPATVIETNLITEKSTSKSQGKKKKKHGSAKVENEPLLEVENGTKPKNSKPKNETAIKPLSKLREKLAKYEEKESKANEKTKPSTDAKTKPSTETLNVCLPDAQDDDVIKRRRVSGEKPGPVSIRIRPQLPAIFQQRKKEDVVTQTSETPKEVPHVISEIEAAPVVDDPQSISLWCNFSHMIVDFSVMWLKEGATLHEEKRKAEDNTRVSLSLLKASRKDLGFYRCTLISASGSVSTSDYHLTSEVLMELVIPNHETSAEREAVDGQEEDVSCAPLLFKEDILTDQYFGEQQHTSIVTEKDHFGEGMHRKAFRTMLRTGMTPLFDPGHACVLKVHSSIDYGAQDNNEVVQKNYNLAVEECYVQNTAREYIKAYTDIAKSAESFGEVPEIIPIVLVHRPSNSIPYATLEEELIGDFVKYSVRDGKEINLMRRDSEAGQKCCAFQHWVYTQTDGNLLVTDMQGVGMKLTDVGIATCKKGYKGFRGNCSTSFIEQFKALHQCNRFCELLGLMSLQPKPKRTAPPNSKAQPAARKKTFGPNVKGKS